MRCWLLLLMLVSATTSAGEIVFYRCTDASGALTIQNMPCPKGMQQTTKIMQAAPEPAQRATLSAPASPLPVLAPLSPAAAAEGRTPAHANAAEPPVAKPSPIPLPALFKCHVRGGESYLSETSEPPSRCVPMRVVGLDGNPDKGAGEACEVQRDTCTPVPAAELCSTWRQRVDEAAAVQAYSSVALAEAARNHQQLRAVLDASDCADQKP